MTANNIVDPNSPAADVGAAMLVSFIQDTKSMLQGMNLGSLQVGTADAGAYFNNEVLEVCDFGVRLFYFSLRLFCCFLLAHLIFTRVQMANVHPWFAMTSIQDAAAWTNEFFEDTDVALANNLTNKPNMYIAETGWPTVSCVILSLFFSLKELF